MQPFQKDIHFSGGKLHHAFVASDFLADLFLLVFSAHCHWLNKASLGELAPLSDCNVQFCIHGFLYLVLQFLKSLAECGAGKGNLRRSLLVCTSKNCKNQILELPVKSDGFEKSLKPLLRGDVCPARTAITVQ